MDDHGAAVGAWPCGAGSRCFLWGLVWKYICWPGPARDRCLGQPHRARRPGWHRAAPALGPTGLPLPAKALLARCRCPQEETPPHSWQPRALGRTRGGRQATSRAPRPPQCWARATGGSGREAWPPDAAGSLQAQDTRPALSCRWVVEAKVPGRSLGLVLARGQPALEEVRRGVPTLPCPSCGRPLVRAMGQGHCRGGVSRKPPLPSSPQGPAHSPGAALPWDSASAPRVDRPLPSGSTAVGCWAAAGSWSALPPQHLSPAWAWARLGLGVPAGPRGATVPGRSGRSRVSGAGRGLAPRPLVLGSGLSCFAEK